MQNYINSEIRNRLQSLGISNKFKSGQIIQFQDDAVEDLYLLESGLAIARFYERGGKESWIDSFETGDLIGVEHIKFGGPSLCQITARTDLVVLQFKRTTFAELMLRNSDLNFFVIGQLTDRLKRFQDNRVESQVLSKRGQVASEIRRLAAPTANPTKGYIVTPKPVISDMALRLGIARETVSRTVSEFVKNDIIERSRNAFIVPDLGLLEAQVR